MINPGTDYYKILFIPLSKEKPLIKSFLAPSLANSLAFLYKINNLPLV
jgi:hypothetical protein